MPGEVIDVPPVAAPAPAAATPSPAPAPAPAGEAGAPAPAPGAPAPAPAAAEELKFNLPQLPEGVELDQASLDEFKAVIGDKDLTASQRAQKIVDLAVKREAGRLEQHKARVQGWVDEVKADKELGGDKLEQTLAVAEKAVQLGPPELEAFLKASGLGNHPAMVKWAYAIGTRLSEDGHVSPGRGGTPPAKPMEDRLFSKTATPLTA